MQDIEDLIIDIVNSSETTVYLKYCITTEDIVVGIKDKTRDHLVGFYPNYKNSAQSSLFLTSIDDLGDDISTIIESLRERYQIFIDNEQYSKNDRERSYYTAEEISFIRSCFS